MGREWRRTLGHGAVVALALVGCTGGDGSGDGQAFDLFGDGPSADELPGTTTTAAGRTEATGSSPIERPDVPQVGCATLLEDEELEILLGLADLPFRERAYFEIVRGETCAYEWTEDSTRTAVLEPGLPSDLDDGRACWLSRPPPSSVA